MHYTRNLTSHEMLLALILVIVLYSLAFIFMPKIRRDIEKSKKPKLSFRGFPTFGNWYFKRYGTFNRITAYDDFFIIIFFGYEKIKYSDIENLKIKNGLFISLSMSVHGVPISIFGRLNQLQNLQEIIKKSSHHKI